MTNAMLDYAMNLKPLSAAFAAIGVAVFTVVAHDATLVAEALGVPARGGEGVVAMTGLAVAFAAVARCLRGLWPARLRVANA